MDPPQWMGADRVQTADKSITTIHMTPVHQLIFYKVQTCIFVIKSIIKKFLTFSSESSIHNIAEKMLAVWIRKEICTDCLLSLQAKTVLNKCWIMMWEDNSEWNFGGRIIIEYGCILARSNILKLKRLVSYKHWVFFAFTFIDKTLIDGLESCGLHMDYCDVFSSCLNSHSDGTHLLLRTHLWASDIMLFLFSKPVPMKK